MASAIMALIAIFWGVMLVAYFTTLKGLPLRSRDRIVGGLDPHFPPALADPLVFGRIVFAAVQLSPELLVRWTLFVGFIDEHAVMFALDLIQGIAEGIQKILVGGDDSSIHMELDHGLRLADRGGLPGLV